MGSSFLYWEVALVSSFPLIKISWEFVGCSRNAERLNEVTHQGAEFSAVVHRSPTRKSLETGIFSNWNSVAVPRTVFERGRVEENSALWLHSALRHSCCSQRTVTKFSWAESNCPELHFDPKRERKKEITVLRSCCLLFELKPNCKMNISEEKCEAQKSEWKELGRN